MIIVLKIQKHCFQKYGKFGNLLGNGEVEPKKIKNINYTLKSNIKI
jgi:hypothetical protein